jgi:hypothetical protein
VEISYCRLFLKLASVSHGVMKKEETVLIPAVLSSVFWVP